MKDPLFLFLMMLVMMFGFAWVFDKPKEPKPEPVPTEATELMVKTFGKTAETLHIELSRCMALIQICERSRVTVDAQIKAIFEVTKEQICEQEKRSKATGREKH